LVLIADWFITAKHRNSRVVGVELEGPGSVCGVGVGVWEPEPDPLPYNATGKGAPRCKPAGKKHVPPLAAGAGGPWAFKRISLSTGQINLDAGRRLVLQEAEKLALAK
jgi:hypothetical protein